MRNENWIKWLVGVSAAIIALAIAGARFFGLMQPLELAAYDAMLAWRASPGTPDRVAVVTVNDEELKSWGWPLPDARLAEIGAASLAAGATLVGIDIYRDAPVGAGGDELPALFRDRRVVGISKLGSDLGPPIRAAPDLHKDNRYGFSDLIVDQDGVARRALLLINDKDGLSLSFALRVALMANGSDAAARLRTAPEDSRTIMLGSTRLPRLDRHNGGYAAIDNRGYQVLIDYRTRLDTIPLLAASDLLDGRVSNRILANKVVLIGTVSESVKDLFLTPYAASDDRSLTPGVVIHAAIVDELLRLAQGQAESPHALPDWIELMGILILAFCGAYAAFFATTLLRLVAAGPVLGILITVASSCALLLNWWLPAAAFGMAWLGSFVVVTGELALLARYRQRVLSALFSAHMSADLADEVWKNRALFLAGMRPLPMRLQSTVLFVDLVGSTRIGGTMEPQSFMAWIGRLLDRLAQVAAANRGFIEKFTGDGMMVVFGAPLPRTTMEENAQDARRACECALQMAAAVDDLNRSRSQMPAYQIRVGIHSGSVLGGSVGSASRMQYTVIGDAANIAARVEAYGKKIAARIAGATIICVTEDVKDLIGCGFGLEAAGSLTHDEGTRTISIYLLTGRSEKGEGSCVP